MIVFTTLFVTLPFFLSLSSSVRQAGKKEACTCLLRNQNNKHRNGKERRKIYMVEKAEAEE